MSDASALVGSIQSWISSVNGAFSAIPSEISEQTSTGNFSDVLAGIQGLLNGASSNATTSAAGVASGQQALLTALSGPQPTGSQVVQTAESFLGVPYSWGGTTPAGFDCSGFTQYVYNQLGVSLPRTSEEQASVGTAVDSVADAQPGDLVFYAGSDGTPSSPGHVGIYIGNGEMIDAPQTGSSVSIQPVGDPVAIRRVLAGTSPTSTDAAVTGASAVPTSLLADFEASASRWNVPMNLLTAVAQTESGFNPNAVSSAGAQGLMQLMPSTAASLGVNPLDPAQAIDGAAQLLSGYLQTYGGSVPLALAAYNAGPAAVAQYGGVPPYAETENYVQSVMSNMGATQ